MSLVTEQISRHSISVSAVCVSYVSHLLVTMDSSTKTMRAESTEQTAQLNDSEGTEAQRQVHSEKMLMRKME